MKYTKMSVEDFKDAKEMVNGNINRMCVTDNLDELFEMAKWSRERIDKILIWRLWEIFNH